MNIECVVRIKLLHSTHAIQTFKIKQSMVGKCKQYDKYMIWNKYVINVIKKYMINTLTILLYITRDIKCLRWKECRFGACASILMFWKYFFSLNLIFYIRVQSTYNIRFRCTAKCVHYTYMYSILFQVLSPRRLLQIIE